MKILLVSNAAHCPSTTWCQAVGVSMANAGHEVTTLVLERDKSLFNNMKDSGVRLINRPLSANIYSAFFFSPLTVLDFLVPDYDIVHVHHAANWGCLMGAIRSRLRGPKLVVTPHTASFTLPKMVNMIYKRLVHFTFNAASAILLLSSFHQEILTSAKLWINEKPSFIVHNPILETFYSIPRKPGPIKNGIYVGRIETYQKAIDRLFPVFEKLRGSNIHFRIIGDGPFRETLAQQIKQNNWTHVELPGEVPNELLPQILSDADFFITPSRYETQPFALLEAMASGLPVISTDIPGITEFCPEDAGFFIHEPDNVEEWTDAIFRLAANPDIAYEMGMKARQAAQPHHPDFVAAEHLEIYRMLITNSSLNHSTA